MERVLNGWTEKAPMHVLTMLCHCMALQKVPVEDRNGFGYSTLVAVMRTIEVKESGG